MRARGKIALVVVAGAAVLAACSTPAPDARVVETVPDRATFPAVGKMLVHSCGTLDCHGTIFRNLRLYGSEGLRLDRSSAPNTLPGHETTTDELDQDFQSVVGLEPEQTSAVVAQHGAAPDRLTLVRKGRGQEAHKGGAINPAGDPGDVCLISWLSGSIDASACDEAAKK